MAGNRTSASQFGRRNPIAACLATTFALATPVATLAATVTSCLDDGGGGTLRSVIAAAAEGATIDFSVACVPATITLANTSIAILQNSLTIDASGAPNQVSVDASALSHPYSDSRVFSHYGNGTLTIKSVDVENGYVMHYSLPSFGGCISSGGNVVLSDATVTNCQVVNLGYSQPALGGGVFANGNLTLQNSTVSYSSTNAVGSTKSAGGGVWVYGYLSLDNGTISHNSATANSNAAAGGGAYVNGNANGFGYIARNEVKSTDGSAIGGGIHTRGKLYAPTAFIKYNSATSTNTSAIGGGFYAVSDTTFQTQSVIKGNSVDGASSFGGGGFTYGDFASSYSSIKYNVAKGPFAFGGGLVLKGANNAIMASTISGNQAYYNIGGLEVYGVTPATTALKIVNSTISGNSSSGVSGGVYSNAGTTKLYNSTFAFNSAGIAAPGVQLGTFGSAMAATLKSNLFIYNTVGLSADDFNVVGPNALTINGGNLATAAKNLVGATSFPTSSLPNDTLIGVCPRLGKLKDNGGLTYTHALFSGSPAIDNGNDSYGALYDQRGKASVNGDADYTRFSGLGAIADIGAYEVQQNDIIFNANFEGCPLL